MTEVKGKKCHQRYKQKTLIRVPTEGGIEFAGVNPGPQNRSEYRKEKTIPEGLAIRQVKSNTCSQNANKKRRPKWGREETETREKGWRGLSRGSISQGVLSTTKKPGIIETGRKLRTAATNAKMATASRRGKSRNR